jgi:hypothetical protein
MYPEISFIINRFGAIIHADTHVELEQESALYNNAAVFKVAKLHAEIE